MNAYNKLIAGYNFLEEHLSYQQQYELNQEHVLVDRKDWKRVITFLYSNPNPIIDIINFNKII